MSDAAERLRRAEARRVLRADLPGHLRQMAAVCQAIRQGLRQLGFDPTRAEMLERYEAQTKGDLAALARFVGKVPQSPAVYRESEAERRFGNDFLNLVRHYRDPTSWAPDIADESVLTLWTFVLARAPEAFAALSQELLARVPLSDWPESESTRYQ